MSNETLANEKLFENSMIVNEKYHDAIYDENGLLYTKLALATANKYPEKSKTYAYESLEYIKDKLSQNQLEIKETLEKLMVILELLTNEKEINLEEGQKLVLILNELIKENLFTARSQYLHTLKQH